MVKLRTSNPWQTTPSTYLPLLTNVGLAQILNWKYTLQLIRRTEMPLINRNSCWLSFNDNVGRMLWQTPSPPYQLSGSNSPVFGWCHKVGSSVAFTGCRLWSPTSEVSRSHYIQASHHSWRPLLYWQLSLISITILAEKVSAKSILI